MGVAILVVVLLGFFPCRAFKMKQGPEPAQACPSLPKPARFFPGALESALPVPPP
jgi:hypothetical protein